MLQYLSAYIIYRKVNGFPRAKLEETVSFEEQIVFEDKYQSIAEQMGSIAFIILFYRFENWIFPSFGCGIFSHVTGLDQWRENKIFPEI